MGSRSFSNLTPSILVCDHPQKPQGNDVNTWPNLLTFARLLLIPVMVIAYLLPFKGSHAAAAMIFTTAAVTDWLDGYLARSLKQVSKFGAFIDPVADKLIVAVALVLVVGESDLDYLSIPAAVIVGREIVISALREWMAEMGKRVSVAVSNMGKLKTAFQMTALVFLLFYKPESGHEWIGLIGYILLLIAAILTLSSMILYIRAAKKDFF